MILFFRKIRKKLADDNKPLKYMRYAFGEIVLVVIGILIAISLNSYNQSLKTEVKIDRIFEDILQELSSDIYSITGLMKFYERKDSIIHLVLSDKLTYEDYVNKPVRELFNLTTYSRGVSLTQHAYDNLVLNMDAIPEKYEDVVKDLKILYSSNKSNVEYYNAETRNFARNTLLERANKHEWFTNYSQNINDRLDEVKYLLNDFRYKNKVTFYQNLQLNHLDHSLIYRKRAVKSYKKIASILNKPTIHDSFKIDPEIIELGVGDYVMDQVPDFRLHVFEEDGRVFYNTSQDTTKIEVYSLSNGKFLSDQLVYSYHFYQGDSVIIKNNFTRDFIKVLSN